MGAINFSGVRPDVVQRIRAMVRSLEQADANAVSIDNWARDYGVPISQELDELEAAGEISATQKKVAWSLVCVATRDFVERYAAVLRDRVAARDRRAPAATGPRSVRQ